MEQAEVIQALFKALLGRDCDPSGIDYYSRMMAPGFSRLEAVIRDIASSDEFRTKQRREEVAAIHNSGLLQAEEGETFDYVMSVGPACYTSLTLDRWGLRRFSGPFDYMFSSLRMVSHVLRDDFVKFLSQDQMFRTEIRKGDIRTQHSLYGPMADYLPGHGGAVFYHHNPLEGPDHDHFQRSAQRMRVALSGRCLLVSFVQNKPDEINAFRDLADYLTERAPSTKLLVVLSEPPTAAPSPDVRLWWKYGIHEAYHMAPIDHLREMGYRNLSDELAVIRLVRRHRFDLKRL